MRTRKTAMLTSVGGDYAHSLARAKNQQPRAPKLERTSQRLAALSLVLVAGFAILGGRFLMLSLGGDPHTARAPSRFLASAENQRPTILDRNGVVLASQLASRTLAARPSRILRPAKTAAGLKTIFPALDEALLLDEFLAASSRYFTIQHDVTPEEQAQILQLGDPGLVLEDKPVRVYPHGAMAGHIVGFVNRDLAGLAGLEYMLDTDTPPAREARAKGVLLTTLDLRVQHIMRDVLQAGLHQYQARAAVGLMMDAQNGEIVSLVSLPDFDPNQPQTASAEARFNRASLGAYELGSIFKLYTAAMALEQKAVDMVQTFDVSQPLQIGRHRISDAHSDADTLNLTEVIAQSSNIGVAQMALAIEPSAHWQYLNRFGFTQRPSFDLPELARPLLPAQWETINRATVAFGHGIAISPLQAVRAAGALVNGGILYEPHLRLGVVPTGKRILSEQTSARLRTLMRSVVKTGTGRQAALTHYAVLGKTGTAEKAVRGGYDPNRLLVSFLSAFPGDNPRYVMLVMLDEPQGTELTYGFAEAGWNVVPLTRDIIGRVAPLLGILPDQKKEESENAPRRIAG